MRPTYAMSEQHASLWVQARRCFRMCCPVGSFYRLCRKLFVESSSSSSSYSASSSASSSFASVTVTAGERRALLRNAEEQRWLVEGNGVHRSMTPPDVQPMTSSALEHQLAIGTMKNKGEMEAVVIEKKLGSDDPPLFGTSDLEEDENEDTCPICLERYTYENPRMMTKCNHSFHLQCAMAWSERSQKCPVCDRKMELVLEMV